MGVVVRKELELRPRTAAVGTLTFGSSLPAPSAIGALHEGDPASGGLSTKTSLSVLVPVYNEQHLVYASLQRLKILESSVHLERVEVIVVDDCSTDETPRVLERFRSEQTSHPGLEIEWILLKHPENKGKGHAVRTALEYATCDISVIHDADLEYHPKDLLRMVTVFVEEEADAVYGS